MLECSRFFFFFRIRSHRYMGPIEMTRATVHIDLTCTSSNGQLKLFKCPFYPCWLSPWISIPDNIWNNTEMIIPRPYNLCLLNPTWMLEKKQQETLRITNIIESRHDGKSNRISQHCLHLLRDLAGLPKAPTSPDAKDLELCYAGFCARNGIPMVGSPICVSSLRSLWGCVPGMVSGWSILFSCHIYIYVCVHRHTIVQCTHTHVYIYYTHRLQCVMNHVLTKWYAHRSAATMIKIHPQKII
jgi:hypothetical protein